MGALGLEAVLVGHVGEGEGLALGGGPGVGAADLVDVALGGLEGAAGLLAVHAVVGGVTVQGDGEKFSLKNIRLKTELFWEQRLWNPRSVPRGVQSKSDCLTRLTKHCINGYGLILCVINCF